MKVRLVTAPTATDYEAPGDAESSEIAVASALPHLGVLTLAAVLEGRGVDVSVTSLNQTYYDYLAAGLSGVDGFAQWACDETLREDACVFGFSSISSSYPVTLRIARLVKERRPDCTVVLGGPQASVVDRQTLAAFPYVDYVLRGESDHSILELVELVEGRRPIERVSGLTYRSPFGPARTGSAPVPQDLDDLPLPAFHLTSELEGADAAPLEIGRGCPYACTFCSTNDFFRRKFRLRSPARVVDDMRSIYSQYGITRFDLTHDMFTVDRKRVVAFCEYMIRFGAPFTWNCSARTDSVDEELLDLMFRAGCKGMFFGVETGSQRMQRVIDKDLDIPQARQVVAMADRIGIETVVSLITGFPDETWDDLRDTLRMYSFALGQLHCAPQLNLLSPLADTPIHSQWREHLTLGELCSDMAHQGRSQNRADRELIEKHPDIFPNFYLVPVPNLDREFLIELREFVLSVPDRLRWLIVALERCGAGAFDIFSAWRKHRIEIRPALTGWALREYYMRDVARHEFVSFVRYSRAESSDPAVACFLSYHAAIAKAKAEQPEQPSLPLTGDLKDDDIPVRGSSIYVLDLDYDVQSVIDGLRSDTATKAYVRGLRHYRTSEAPGEKLRLIETHPTIAAALHASDGRNTIADFVNRMLDHFDGQLDNRRLAVHYLLERLRDEGLICIYHAQSARSGAPELATAAGC